MGMSSLNKSKVKVFFYHSTTPLKVNLLLLIRSWSSDLLYTHQRGTVLQEDQRVGHQEDVQKHLCPAAEPHQHHHVQGGRPRLRQVSMCLCGFGLHRSLGMKSPFESFVPHFCQVFRSACCILPLVQSWRVASCHGDKPTFSTLKSQIVIMF